MAAGPSFRLGDGSFSWRCWGSQPCVAKEGPGGPAEAGGSGTGVRDPSASAALGAGLWWAVPACVCPRPRQRGLACRAEGPRQRAAPRGVPLSKQACHVLGSGFKRGACLKKGAW